MVEAPESHRVLIVEDEYYLAADLELALRSEGAEVVGPICKLSDAFFRVAGSHFHAAVLDISLQNEHAYGLADELMRRRIPFVFATGYSPGAIPSRFSDVTRFEKPYDTACIARHVVQLCERGSNAVS
jgi:DNA-binding NtrC family response regulator